MRGFATDWRPLGSAGGNGFRCCVLRRAWLAGPLHVRVGMTELMLRRADAARVGLEAWPVAA